MKPSSRMPTQKPTVKIKRHSEHFCCLCRKIAGLRGVIGCNFCEDWYHNSCLNLKKEDVDEFTKCEWKCPKCEFPSAFLEEQKHHYRCAKVVEKQSKDQAQERINNDNGSTSSEERERHSEHFCYLCREPAPLRGVIGCNFCEQWYHNSCLNLKKEEVDQLANDPNWKCPKCEPNYKQAKARERTNNDNGSTSSEELR
jgi:hypothetical protein